MMKKHGLAIVAIALAAVAAPALASEELAKKNACTACHGIDKKLVGPAYRDVAAKYRGNAKAAAMLQEKVKKGSVGTWGQVPMPPNAAVKDADVKALVDWVLALK
jgi:cytochrome c